MLTSQDLKQIEKLLDKQEVKISKNFDSKLDLIESKLSKKIDTRADQIIEYINVNIEAHEKWLQNHEVRITNVENTGYHVNDQKKLK